MLDLEVCAVPVAIWMLFYLMCALDSLEYLFGLVRNIEAEDIVTISIVKEIEEIIRTSAFILPPLSFLMTTFRLVAILFLLRNLLCGYGAFGEDFTSTTSQVEDASRSYLRTRQGSDVSWDIDEEEQLRRSLSDNNLYYYQQLVQEYMNDKYSDYSSNNNDDGMGQLYYYQQRVKNYVNQKYSDYSSNNNDDSMGQLYYYQQRVKNYVKDKYSQFASNNEYYSGDDDAVVQNIGSKVSYYQERVKNYVSQANQTYSNYSFDNVKEKVNDFNYNATLQSVEYKAEATMSTMFQNPMSEWTWSQWTAFALALFCFGCAFFISCCCCVIPSCCSRRMTDLYGLTLLSNN